MLILANSIYIRVGGRKGFLALLSVSSRRLNGSNSNKRRLNIEKPVKFRAIKTDILRGLSVNSLISLS